MLTITTANRTNNALRYATALTQLAQNSQGAAEVKASMLGAMWQLELAQQVWCQEILEATLVANLHADLVGQNLSVEELINTLNKYERVIPELNRLAQLQKQYPELQLSQKVAATGDIAFENNSKIIGSSDGLAPTADSLRECCVKLTQLIEQCRETYVEW